MLLNLKEVYFNEYCHKCVHHLKAENEEPCDECLTKFYQWASHKPFCFREKEDSKT